MPAKGYTILSEVGFKQPVMIRHVSFRATSTSFAWADRCYTGHAYSPAQYESESPVVRRTCGTARLAVEVKRRNRLFLVPTFCLVL